MQDSLVRSVSVLQQARGLSIVIRTFLAAYQLPAEVEALTMTDIEVGPVASSAAVGVANLRCPKTRTSGDGFGGFA